MDIEQKMQRVIRQMQRDIDRQDDRIITLMKFAIIDGILIIILSLEMIFLK